MLVVKTGEHARLTYELVRDWYIPSFAFHFAPRSAAEMSATNRTWERRINGLGLMPAKTAVIFAFAILSLVDLAVIVIVILWIGVCWVI